MCKCGIGNRNLIDIRLFDSNTMFRIEKQGSRHTVFKLRDFMGLKDIFKWGKEVITLLTF